MYFFPKCNQDPHTVRCAALSHQFGEIIYRNYIRNKHQPQPQKVHFSIMIKLFYVYTSARRNAYKI